MRSKEPRADAAEARALIQCALRAQCDPGAGELLIASIAAPVNNWAAICDLAETERVAPLLYTALRDLSGAPAAVLARLADTYRDNTQRSQVYRRELSGVLAALDGAAIDVVVLKGAALVETLYSDSAQRRMSDIDLLVPRADFAAARDALAPLGFVPLVAEPRPGEVEYESQCLLRKEGPIRVRVELHWSLFDSPYYQHRLPMDWFWQTTEAATIAGQRARMLGPEAQVLHLCAHLRLHHSGTELRWLHDVALLIARWGARIDWALVVERAQEFDLVLPLRDVLGRVAAGWDVVPACVLRRVEALEPSRREARVFRWLTEPNPTAMRRLWIDIASLPGWWPRLAFAWTNLMPPPSYMRRRYGIRHRLLVPLYYPYRWVRGVRRPRDH